jgi:pimeloyl-ACP methyl ester carboxylesterase
MSTMPDKHQVHHTEVQISADDVRLDGLLVVEPASLGLVLMLERTGTTLATDRSAFIAAALQQAGLSTLQVGMLGHEEERHAPDNWHQVSLLATRLEAVVTWVSRQPGLQSQPLVVLAREAAAGAAVRVAARKTSPFVAIACRGGRPDLAGMEPLRALRTPLLMVAGEYDAVLPANRQVEQFLAGGGELIVVAGASHTLEEPGTLDEASRHFATWFQRQIAASDQPAE